MNSTTALRLEAEAAAANAPYAPVSTTVFEVSAQRARIQNVKNDLIRVSESPRLTIERYVETFLIRGVKQPHNPVWRFKLPKFVAFFEHMPSSVHQRPNGWRP